MPHIRNFYFNEKEFRSMPKSEQLWHACYENELHVAEQLLSEGADTNVPLGIWNKTCLHLAAERQNRLLLQLLMRNQASPTAVMKNGQTVLHIIINHGVESAKEAAIAKQTGQKVEYATTVFEMCRDIVEKAPKLITKKDFTQLAPVDIATQLSEHPDSTLQQQEIAHYLQKHCGRLQEFPGQSNGKDVSNVKALLGR